MLRRLRMGREAIPRAYICQLAAELTVERLVRHVIADHGLTPISPSWEAIITDGEAHYRDVQAKRVLTPRDSRE